VIASEFRGDVIVSDLKVAKMLLIGRCFKFFELISIESVIEDARI
jgi:hypothetical protein